MRILKKQDIKNMLKVGAKARGVSVSEFRAEIQENIDNAVKVKTQWYRNILKSILVIRYLHQKNTFTQSQRKLRFKCLSCFLRSRSAG